MTEKEIIEFDRKHIWHPYSSIGNPLPCYPVRSAHGVYLELEDGQVYDPIDLEWIVIDYTENFDIPADPAIACLDMDLLSFPLILRHWQAGDYFRPFGMKGMKKISDFLIDQKVSRPDKGSTWLVTSGQKIVWVVGHRIDYQFRITDRTKKVLMMKFKSRQGYEPQ